MSVLLTSCGSRATAPVERVAAPVKETAAPVDARPAIVAFGDSLSAGFGAEPGRTYPDFLQKAMDARGLNYRVVNLGVSGDTTTDGLARVELVTALKPVLVIVEFGGNDGLRGLPVTTTRENLTAIVDALSGTKVVLAGMTLPPNYGPEYIRSFEAVYRDLARQKKLPLIPFLLEGVGGDAALMQRDGIHPTEEGYRRVAATVMKAIAPLL